MGSEMCIRDRCNDAELERLHKLEERGLQNGLEGIEFLGREAMLEREPNVGGIAALRVPQEGIIDYPVRSARRESFRSVASIINWLRAAKG